MQEEDNIEFPAEISAGQVQYRPEQDLQEEGVRRKQSCKLKHVEGDVDHLQRHMQGMQETNLLQAQQRPLGPLGPGELM